MFLKMVVDGRPLPDAFAPSFFKFLLGIPPNLQDLEAYLTLPPFLSFCILYFFEIFRYDTVLALSFRKLLVLERVEDFLSETFEGLEPGGENKQLTDANKEEYLLFCFVLFCFVLFCFVLFCFVLFCFVLFCVDVLTC